MARRKRLSTAAPTGSAAAQASSKAQEKETLWKILTKSRNKNEKMNPKELTFLLSTLTTLVDNGVSTATKTLRSFPDFLAPSLYLRPKFK
jgi:hypothetical protein